MIVFYRSDNDADDVSESESDYDEMKSSDEESSENQFANEDEHESAAGPSVGETSKFSAQQRASNDRNKTATSTLTGNS